MSIYDFDNKRAYTKYKRHTNDSHERISANTINKLQTDLQNKQASINNIKDDAWTERVYTIFDNNLYVNSMFIDVFKNGEYTDLSNSQNVVIDNNLSQLLIKDTTRNGIAVSFPIYSTYGQDVEMNDFFLIVNEDIPVGASIRYRLEKNTGESWPIKPNAMKLPMHLTENLSYGFRIVAELTTNSLNESPKICGYAILYWDAAVEEALGMTNPDLRRFP